MVNVLEVHPVVFLGPNVRRGDLGLMRWREPTHRTVRVVDQERVMNSVPSILTQGV